MKSVGSPKAASRHASALCLAVIVVLLTQSSGECADKVDAARSLGKQRRDADIAEAKDRVAELEKKRLAGGKGQSAAASFALQEQIKEAKREVAKITKKTIEDYAKEENDSLEKVAKVAPAGVARCFIDSNARLVVEELGALRATQFGVPDAFPVLRAFVFIATDEPVESVEVSCHAYDSFDKQFVARTGEGAFKEQATGQPGQVLRKGQLCEIRIGFPRAPENETYSCKVWVSQVRMADGKVWQCTFEEAAANEVSLATAKRMQRQR